MSMSHFLFNLLQPVLAPIAHNSCIDAPFSFVSECLEILARSALRGFFYPKREPTVS
jgi:hypothetical protein